MSGNKPRRPRTGGVLVDGAKLRDLRKLSGRTLVQFAEAAGISHQYLGQVELGERPTVSPPVFARICDALGISPENRRSLVKTAPALEPAEAVA